MNPTATLDTPRWERSMPAAHGETVARGSRGWPAAYFEQLPKRELPNHGLVLKITKLGGVPEFVNGDGVTLAHGTDADRAREAIDQNAREWRTIASKVDTLNAELETIRRQWPTVAEVLAPLLGASPNYPSLAGSGKIPLGTVHVERGEPGIPTALVEAALRAHGSGELGTFGAVDAVKVTDDDRFAPPLAAVPARNRLAVEEGKGAVRSRHELAAADRAKLGGETLDILTLLDPLVGPSTYVRVGKFDNACFGA